MVYLDQKLFINTFQTTIGCPTGAGPYATSLKLGDQPGAFLYGTNAFPQQEGGAIFDMNFYAYTGAVCDCATSAAVASGAPCQDG